MAGIFIRKFHFQFIVGHSANIRRCNIGANLLFFSLTCQVKLKTKDFVAKIWHKLNIYTLKALLKKDQSYPPALSNHFKIYNLLAHTRPNALANP